MRKLIFLFTFLGLMACGNIIDKPQNLVDEDTMSQIIAELAIDDQFGIYSPDFRPEEQTKFIFQQHHVSYEAFRASYTYYVSNKRIDHIYDKAQELIVAKDPKAKEYIEKRNKEQNTLPQQDALQQ